MPRRRRRTDKGSDAQQPRVDDFFYGNPDAPEDAAQGGETPHGDGRSDGDADGPPKGAEPESADAPASGDRPDESSAPSEEQDERATEPESVADQQGTRADRPVGLEVEQVEWADERDPWVEGPAEPDEDGEQTGGQRAQREEDFALRGRGHPEDDPAHPDHDALAAARRRRLRAGGRWGRLAVVVAVAGTLVWAAGSGQIGSVDLAQALGHEESTPGESPQTAGLSVITDAGVACVGPELVGLDDPSVPESEQTISVWAGSAPSEALPEGITPTGDGAVTLDVIAPGGAAGEAAEGDAQEDAGEGAAEDPGGSPAEDPGGSTGQSAQTAIRGDAAKLAVSGAHWVRVGAAGSMGAGLAASQVSVSLQEQERGLATAACLEARDDTWLVGGGNEVGRVERLVLVNPTGNPVTADVEVLGALGVVEVAGGRGVVVPAHGRQVLLLDALAPGEDRPVVHVTSVGGPVMAALGERWLEGTLDRGRELTTGTAAPATSLLIPAVPAPRADSADTAQVRVGVPGAETAVVQLRALTSEGPVRVANDVTTVNAGAVTDIDISDLPVGTHAIEVVADTPVVAAAQVQRRTDPESVGDLAWVPAVAPTDGLLGVPLAHRGDQELGRQLSVASLEGAGLAVVSVSGGVSESAPLEVPAGGQVAVALDPEIEGIWLQVTNGSASAAVITSVEDELGTLVAGLPVPEAPLTRQVRSVAPWLP
ncbi:DUF5719 family protein [Ornithinimicrobium cryptoxanthini]|uniref:DUF5719 family protein n=1 Tax=Ornithinimicrobium cryptoxanthini TaxID=2934161 RepID=A0ABY4YET5_9MICO|nr:DUF5719 family protein [Ornithinimicrobium cryptoxanthini]USQ75296.1 DUF5719 family protein [Ornithinimicrobium cryptoxanthini]